jgi:hypothetical protein
LFDLSNVVTLSNVMRLPKVALVFVLVLLFGPLFIAGGQDRSARIVAIGDIHGAYPAFEDILHKAQLTGPGNHWIAGKTIFIQVGDVLDRGPESRKAMDLLMQLETEAARAEGKVVPLLGNHEVMNIIGDLRYVSAEEYASYATQNSQSRQKEALKLYEDFLSRKESKKNRAVRLTSKARMEWNKKHPPGYIEHREAFSVVGKYGKWVRGHLAVLQMDDLVFLHGGISPAISDVSIESMNSRIQEEIRNFDMFKRYMVERKSILPFFDLDEIVSIAKSELAEIQSRAEDQLSEDEKAHAKKLQTFLGLSDWLSTRPDGPLWFRGYAEWSEEEGKPNVDRLLDQYHIQHLIVAHTVQPDGRIHSRFNGRVFLIDTGMLSSVYPQGRASALEIMNGRFTAIYPDGNRPFVAH